MGNERRIDLGFVIVANAFLRRDLFRLEDIGKPMLLLGTGADQRSL